LKKDVKLHAKGIDKQSVDQSRKVVGLERSHQIAKPNKNHSIDIFESKVSLQIERVSIGCGIHPDENAQSDDDDDFEDGEEDGEVGEDVSGMLNVDVL